MMNSGSASLSSFIFFLHRERTGFLKLHGPVKRIADQGNAPYLGYLTHIEFDPGTGGQWRDREAAQEQAPANLLHF
jgi:hypothetical protein